MTLKTTLNLPPEKQDTLVNSALFLYSRDLKPISLTDDTELLQVQPLSVHFTPENIKIVYMHVTAFKSSG